jgi:hypothetical protein
MGAAGLAGAGFGAAGADAGSFWLNAVRIFTAAASAATVKTMARTFCVIELMFPPDWLIG